MIQFRKLMESKSWRHVAYNKAENKKPALLEGAERGWKIKNCKKTKCCVEFILDNERWLHDHLEEIAVCLFWMCLPQYVSADFISSHWSWWLFLEFITSTGGHCCFPLNAKWSFLHWFPHKHRQFSFNRLFNNPSSIMGPAFQGVFPPC